MFKDDEQRVIHIRSGCTICRTCEFLAPTQFEVPEKTVTAVALKDRPDTDEEAAELRDAMRDCPVKIISFRPRPPK